MKKPRTIGLEGLEFGICNAVGRWPGELSSHFAVAIGALEFAQVVENKILWIKIIGASVFSNPGSSKCMNVKAAVRDVASASLSGNLVRYPQ